MKTYQYTQFLQSPLMERFMANASEIFDLEGKLSVLVKQNPERFKILQEKTLKNRQAWYLKTTRKNIKATKMSLRPSVKACAHHLMKL